MAVERREDRTGLAQFLHPQMVSTAFGAEPFEGYPLAQVVVEDFLHQTQMEHCLLVQVLPLLGAEPGQMPWLQQVEPELRQQRLELQRKQRPWQQP